jgi:hypothetical protein
MPVIVRPIPSASRKGPTTDLRAASTTVARARGPTVSPASSSSGVRGLHRAGLPVGRHLARSVKERGEDGVDLVGGQQGGTVAEAG